MAKLWSTEEILGSEKRELLVWHHRLNCCSLKYLLRISKRGIIPRKISNVRPPPCVARRFVQYHKRQWRTKGKGSDGSIRKQSETRPRAMTSIDQMVSSHPGIITQVTGDIKQERLWESTVFVDHYYNYCYAHLTRVTSDEETLQDKESYKRLESSNGASVCAYREDNRRFTDTLFKETVNI